MNDKQRYVDRRAAFLVKVFFFYLFRKNRPQLNIKFSTGSLLRFANLQIKGRLDLFIKEEETALVQCSQLNAVRRLASTG